MKLLLVYPSDFFADFSSTPISQQLFYLYSYVKHRAPEVEVDTLDLAAELGSPATAEEVETFLREAEGLLARRDFDMVGISCWCTYNYSATLAIARLCKRLNPEAQLIVGGYHPTFEPQDFVYPGAPFDFVVQGEGEQALLRIARGEVAPAAAPVVVAGVPLPMGEHVLYWGDYRYHRTLDKLPLWLSRGCPFACVFCADRLTNYRNLAPQAALDEVKRAVAANPGAGTVMFYDPLFGIQREWRREFLRLLRHADLPVSYWAESRADLLDPEDVEMVADMVFRLDLGLESVVPEMLAIMKKTNDPARYLARCWELDARMASLKVPHVYNQIFNHPGETTRTLEASMGFWQQYFQQAGAAGYTCVSVSRFRLFPGSEVHGNWPAYEERYGARAADREWWKQPGYPTPNASGDVVPSRELAEAGLLALSDAVAMQVGALASARARLEAFRPFRLDPPYDWATTVLQARGGAAYFDDKPLGLAPRAVCQQRLDGSVTLYSFVSGGAVALDARQTGQVRQVLAGRTAADLAQEFAIYPNAEARRELLRLLLARLLALDILRLAYPPPVANGGGPRRVTLRTSAGELEAELFPEAAPTAVAGVAALLRAGYYGGLRFVVPHPGRAVEVGTYAGDLGPGYTLPDEAPALPSRRGALALLRCGDGRLHGGLIRLQRADGPDERAAVFGQLLAGWEVLDGLLPGDYVLGAAVADQPGGNGG